MADEGTTSTSTEGAPQGQPQGGDGGFPANTPLEQMTAEQQVAYWKSQSRKHEDRVKAFGKLTPDELAALRDKAEKHDALEHELSSEADKRAADARKAAFAEADGKYLPKLARAHLEGAASGRITPEQLAAALEFTDMSKFIADGEVDADRVKTFIDSIAPATGTQQQQQRPGPSSAGQGHRSPAVTKPGEAGRLAAASRGFIKTA